MLRSEFITSFKSEFMYFTTLLISYKYIRIVYLYDGFHFESFSERVWPRSYLKSNKQGRAIETLPKVGTIYEE